jgi:hypothetical protein
MLIVAEVVDPKVHPRLALEFDLQGHQEIVEVILPGMADKEVSWPDIIGGGFDRLLLLPEQL